MFRGLLTLLFLLGVTLSPREYCASQHPDAQMVNSICIGSGIEPTDYFSIGQEPFRSIYSKVFDYSHNSISSGNTVPSEESTLIIKMYAIKTRTDRFLAGWLFITFSVPSGKGRIHQFYLQMEDEKGNAVGEFVNKAMCSAKKRKREVVEPRKVISAFKNRHLNEYYIPCGQVGPAATMVSNTISFAWHDKLFNSAMKDRLTKHYGSGLATTGTSVNWRFSHTSCDKPQKIRLRAYILTDKDISGTHRSSWINVNWFGAADILNEGEKGICKGLQIYPPLATPGPQVPWVKSVDEKIAPTEATTNKDIVRTKKFCKPVYIDRGVNVRDVPTFGGRCLKHDEYKTSNTFLHECTAGVTADASFMKYTEYMERRRSCMQINECPCQCRTDPIDNTSSALSPPSCPRKGSFVKDIMRSRKAHGIAMLFVTMVLVPYSILVSRYFKETWLDKAQSKLHVWYLAHVALTFFTICLYLFGSLALRRSKNLLGDSLVGESHRGIGWATIAFFILATFTGPFRPLSNANQKTRKIVMIIHALVGIIYYSLGMAAVITSSWIPGSPSATEVDCFASPSFTKYSTSSTIPLVVTWIVMDFGFHVIFMLLLCWADRSLHIERSMYLPLISILKYGGHHDMKGFRYRKLMLFIYGICNFGIVLELIIRIGNSTKAGCGFGPMSCTQKTGCVVF